ncbi:MAG: hypothetical protein JWN36_3176 [Microbacteriaceae bacterium]|jgi:hypothetical protein|nr:hypothetical protein [Microbacteriaceae bacterium]
MLLDITDTYSQQMSAGGAAWGIGSGIIGYILTAIVFWRIFTKAGRPGWLALIPIVNTIVLIQVSGHSGWTVLFYLVPILNIVWSIVIAVHLGESFRKSGVFSFFLLWLLSIIGYFILAFDSSTYVDRRTGYTGATA